MTTRDLDGMRTAYLFHLARLCGLKPGEIDDLDLLDFANYTDQIDTWIPIELRLEKEVSLFG